MSFKYITLKLPSAFAELSLFVNVVEKLRVILFCELILLDPLLYVTKEKSKTII